MREKLKILLIVSPLVLALDQLTKWLIVRFVPLGARIPVWENFFDIVHTRNKGAAFGILSGWDSIHREWFFYLLSAVAIFFLATFLRQAAREKNSTAIPIALILGGAIGNITDRIFRGSVVDFLSFHWYDRSVNRVVFDIPINFDLIWPAFNVADSAITVGVFWLMILLSMKKSA